MAMDSYLKQFIDYLKEKLSDELACVMIYGSYVQGYFDDEKSDYDVFVLFKNEVIDLKSEIAEKFPKVSLQLYMNLDEFKNKILKGGWNTFIVTVHTGEVLYSTPEFNELRGSLKNYLPDISKFNIEQRKAFIAHTRQESKVIAEREGYDLNKFVYHSLKKRLQIIHFLKTREIEFEFGHLVLTSDSNVIKDNQNMLLKLENIVKSRDSNLLTDRSIYESILNSVDNQLEEVLMGS